MKHEFTDQLGNVISLKQLPQRIISLVPSQTELLYELGAGHLIAGQTLFCIHPKWAHDEKPRVGGTKKIQINKVHQLKPDLIIGNKEENSKEQIEELMKHYPVWMSDIQNLEDAMDMIEKVGAIAGKTDEAIDIRSIINESFRLLSPASPSARALYFIWREPWMAAGAQTFIGDMMNRCGWTNVAPATRYPVLSAEEIIHANPDEIFLSSEPYPFKQNHIQELKTICPEARIRLVDGELFSWYGSRLLRSAAYFRTLITKE